MADFGRPFKVLVDQKKSCQSDRDPAKCQGLFYASHLDGADRQSDGQAAGQQHQSVDGAEVNVQL